MWRELRATKNLIEFGISDVNQKIEIPNRETSGFDVTPATLATLLHNEEALQVLMEHTETTFNNTVNLKELGRTPPLWCAVLSHTCNDKVLSMLLSSDRVDVNILSETKATPLMAAIVFEEERAVQLLLDSKKASTRLRTCSGRTTLSIAAGSGNKAIFEMISAHGRLFNLADFTRRTTLFFAIEGGNHEIVKSILSDSTVSVMEKDIYGAIPLSIAARLGDTVSSMILLRENARAQLIHKDKFGRTALAWAASCGHAGTRDFLSRKCKELGLSSEDENTCPIIRQINRCDERFGEVCAVCLLKMGVGEFYYSCRKCWRGNFLVCRDCRDRLKPQPGCLQETHTLKPQKLVEPK